MNLVVILLFMSVFLAAYLAQHLNVISGYWVLVPELLSGVAVLVVLARLVGAKKLLLDWRYGLFLSLLFLILLFGFVAQSTPSGVVVAGLRNYVKYIPFFLLAVIYPFTARQLKVQLGFLLMMLIVQSPLAVYQRFVQFADKMHTGDPVRGMATTSSALTLLMVCAIALVVSLYLRRRLSFPLLLIAMAIFVVPTTLNETKSTLIMLPVAMLAPALFMPAGSRVMRRLIPLASIGVLAIAGYASGYNYLIQNREYGRDIGSFFTSGYVERYLYTGAAEGEGKWIGRFDSVKLATDGISADPLKIAFGFGAGNVSKSSLPGFDGQYASYVDLYGVGVTQVSNLLWEVGVVGLFAYLLLYWFIFRDARLLTKSDSPFAIYGQVWATVMIIMTMALMYKSVFSMGEITYPFWFYSGVVARNAYLQRQEARRKPATAQSDRVVSYRHQPSLT